MRSAMRRLCRSIDRA